MSEETQVSIKDALIILSLKHGEALAKDLAVKVLIPVLKEVVSKSENKIDDAILLALEAPLTAALLEQIDKIYKPA